MWECKRDLRVLGLGLALVSAVLSGCASARMSDTEADRLFRDAKYSEAAEFLKGRLQPGSFGAPGSNDELLYLLDLGLSLHQAGQWEASNAYFALAEKHLSLNGYTSVSEEAGTLLTSENTKVYRGEDFEKVLIHVYKALNYASLGGIEDALVEARLVNRRLEELKREGEKPYKQNAFARYFSGILYEAEGEFNDAYIDYKKTYELEPGFRGVGRDLWRMARALRLREDAERWQQEFSLNPEDTDRTLNSPWSAKSGKGELVVVFQNGIGPIKRPDPHFHSLPIFVRRFNPVTTAVVEVNGIVRGQTSVLHDIEATAIENLQEKVAAMAAKRVAGRVAKYVAADQVRRRTGSEALGALTDLILVISDQADTRSWNLLPKDLQMLRIPVEAGHYRVTLKPQGGAELPARDVEVHPGSKVFLSFRFMP